MTTACCRRVSKDDPNIAPDGTLTAELHAIQCASYPETLCEPLVTFSEILRDGRSWILECTEDGEWEGRIIGYALVHEWGGRGIDTAAIPRLGEVPPSRHEERGEGHKNVEARHIFVHDLCVSPRFRGLGYGGLLARRLLRHHYGVQDVEVSLIALPQAVSFWRRLGFSTPSHPSALFPVPECYGPGAVLMTASSVGSKKND